MCVRMGGRRRWRAGEVTVSSAGPCCIPPAASPGAPHLRARAGGGGTANRSSRAAVLARLQHGTRLSLLAGSVNSASSVCGRQRDTPPMFCHRFSATPAPHQHPRLRQGAASSPHRSLSTLEYLCYLCLAGGNNYEKQIWSHVYSSTDVEG